MKLRPKKRHIIIAAVNAAAAAGVLALTAAGSGLARSQTYNSAGKKWGGNNGSFTQLSCFFTDDSGFTCDTVNAVRSEELNILNKVSVAPEDGKTLVPDAYCAPVGNFTVRCDRTGRSEAEITAVGGKFFMFRDFTVLDGAFFTDDDIMQDGAVIDRQLAWSLYGSEDIAGMNLYINDVKFYIAAVIDTPSDKLEKKAAGDVPKAYISYDGASSVALSDSVSGSGISAAADDLYGGGYSPAPSGFNKVTCYECIMPDPVENYAFNSLRTYFDAGYKNKFDLVNNSTRFSSSVRAKAFRSFSDYAVRKNTVMYPYWENASRMAEFKLSPICFFRRLLLMIPLLTGLWLLWLAFRFIRRKGKALPPAVIDKIYSFNYKRRLKKSEQQNDNS